MGKRYKDDEIPTVPTGYRVPPDAPEAAKKAADFAFQVYIDAAAGRLHSKRAMYMLKAAKDMRNEVCGPIAQKVDVDLKGRLEHLLGQSIQTPEPTPEPKEPESDPEG